MSPIAAVGEEGQNISLGTAMAVSGAAVSPSMGYHSSPVLAFLMTLFNLRLGWWLGNPKSQDGHWKSSNSENALWPILCELLSWTNDKSDYVYLSDGGHFENLGVYEMLRRHCRTIVVVDAAEDRHFTFEDLGNLLRKARIDLDVEITFQLGSSNATAKELGRLGLVNRPKAPVAAPYCIVGDIYYRRIDRTGTLIYIKSAIHGDEPEDIRSYAAAHPHFPHETTGDQFFSESQFESYRRLGEYIGTKVFDGPEEGRSNSIDLERRAEAHCREFAFM